MVINMCYSTSLIHKSGVQHDVPFSRLVAAGCAPCFEAPYGSASKSQDITSCSGWNADGRQASAGHRRFRLCASAANRSFKKRAVSVKWSLLAFHEGLLVRLHSCHCHCYCHCLCHCHYHCTCHLSVSSIRNHSSI